MKIDFFVDKISWKKQVNQNEIVFAIFYENSVKMVEIDFQKCHFSNQTESKLSLISKISKTNETKKKKMRLGPFAQSNVIFPPGGSVGLFPYFPVI